MFVLSISEKPMSSIPLTGDSQTDSDILAFIKARQNVLQKKCKNIPWKPAKAWLSLLFCPTQGVSRKLQRKEAATAVVWVTSCELSPASPSPGGRCVGRWLGGSCCSWAGSVSLFQTLVVLCLLKTSLAPCPAFSKQEGAEGGLVFIETLARVFTLLEA